MSASAGESRNRYLADTGFRWTPAFIQPHRFLLSLEQLAQPPLTHARFFGSIRDSYQVRNGCGPGNSCVGIY